ncbi:hypothetical protein vseg_005448 [Gypsophila vaccaria]
MGQIFSSIWRRVRSKLRNETKTLVDDPLHEQPSHYITIPDAEIEHVSSSIPENNVPCIVVNLGGNNAVHNKEEEDYGEENGREKLIQVVEKKIVDDSKQVVCIRRIGVYSSKHKILLVGEGDFSFSACLAVAFASATNIVATSLDSQEFLMKNYKKFMTNKAQVESRGGVVMHGVDVKRMSKNEVLGCLKFDRIVYNFPHTGDFGRTQLELRNNKELVRGFIRNAKKMMNDDGEIHIRHKTNGFFQLWDIPKIGSDQGLFLIRKPKFHRSEYPGYHTKFGFGGDKDFDCTPSRTYIFRLFP